MYQPQRVRQGWVKIHRRPNGKFAFTGLPIIGRDRQGGMSNRILWPHHRSPEWFRELCDMFADTNFLVEVRLVKLFHTGIALIEPVAPTKEQALYDYQGRYGLVPNLTPDVPYKKPDDLQIGLTAYDNAFRAHAHAAELLGLEVIENVQDGLLSRTHVIDKQGKPLHIVGGMLVNKVVKGYKPDDPKWQTALKAFVRVKEIK